MSRDTKPLSDKGCALITGVTVLENCRILDHDKPRLLTFDAHIYVPSKNHHADEILAIVRFYTHNTDIFLGRWSEIGPCFMHATITAMPPDAKELATPGVDISRYNCICNAMMLIPMGTDKNYLPEPSQLVVFGTVNAIVKHTAKKLVFTITPMQYMLALKDVSSLPRQPFPVRCKVDLTSPRYMKADGKPWAPDVRPNGRVTVFGAITCLVREGGSGDHISWVKLSVNEVVYCGGGGPLFPSPTNKYDLGSPLQGKGKQPPSESPLKFSFCDLTTPMLDNSSQLSPVIPQKRPRNDDPTPSSEVAQSGPCTAGKANSESTQPMRIKLPPAKRGGVSGSA